MRLAVVEKVEHERPAHFPVVDQLRQLESLLEEFPEVFKKDGDPPTLPPKRAIEHKIPPIDEDLKRPPRRAYKMHDSLRSVDLRVVGNDDELWQAHSTVA
jgi:hypothetical protein